MVMGTSNKEDQLRIERGKRFRGPDFEPGFQDRYAKRGACHEAHEAAYKATTKLTRMSYLLSAGVELTIDDRDEAYMLAQEVAELTAGLEDMIGNIPGVDPFIGSNQR